MKYQLLRVAAVIAILFTSSHAYAYLDPGTGSAILQGLLAAFAALAVTAKLYWHRLLRLLGIRKDTRSRNRDTADKEQADKEDEAVSRKD